MNTPMPELPVVAYGYENTRPTGEKTALMMVKLGNSSDQYPELAVPLVRLSDAIAAIEAATEQGKRQPPYPEGDVVGPCVCGSWPGGKCLKCPWTSATPQGKI